MMAVIKTTMNIYYEFNKNIADRVFNGCTNFVQRNVLVRNNGEDVRFSITAMQYSDRAWEETEKGVRYIKYRLDYPIPQVDMEEFVCIKLKSKRYDGR